MFQDPGGHELASGAGHIHGIFTYMWLISMVNAGKCR